MINEAESDGIGNALVEEWKKERSAVFSAVENRRLVGRFILYGHHLI